jgi:hypothetical protein
MAASRPPCQARRGQGAFGDDLPVGSLDAIGDHLLMNIESHKIGVHRFLLHPEIGPSQLILDGGRTE